MTEPDDLPEPRPFSWDAVAAEVAAGLEDDETPVEGWDVVARQLAAGLTGPDVDVGTARPTSTADGLRSTSAKRAANGCHTSATSSCAATARSTIAARS